MNDVRLSSCVGAARQLRNVDLNVLWVFEAIDSTRSLADAATRLGLTQPGLSRALARLRSEFDDPLFVKAKGELVLTPRGATVAAAIHDVLARLETALSEGREFEPATAAWNFALSAVSGFSAVLVALQARLKRDAPEMSLEVVPALAGRFDSLEGGTLDFSIGARPAPGRGLLGRTLLRDDLVCLLRSSHPALDPGDLRLEDFVAFEHVDVAPYAESGGQLDELLAKQNLKRTVRVRLHDLAAAAELVAGSDMIALVPSQTAARLAQVYPLSSAPSPLDLCSFELFLAWHERMQKDPAHAWLRQLIAEVAEKHATPSGRVRVLRSTGRRDSGSSRSREPDRCC